MSKVKKPLTKETNITLTPKTDIPKNDISKDLEEIKELLVKIAVSIDKLYVIMPFKK